MTTRVHSACPEGGGEKNQYSNINHSESFEMHIKMIKTPIFYGVLKKSLFDKRGIFVVIPATNRFKCLLTPSFMCDT